MKSSKHVETCFVRANNDFDDKLSAFWMKNNFWTKIPKNGHCVYVKEIKIATGDDVLSNSWFYLVNWHLGKFGPRPGGG